MRRLLLILASIVAGSSSAFADSTVPALTAATNLTSGVTYIANGGANDTKAGFDTSVHCLSGGNLTLCTGGVVTAAIANAAITYAKVQNGVGNNLLRSNTGAAPSELTVGTGVLTALGVNTGSAGAFVTFGGALGTPSSATLTNATGLSLTSGVTGILPGANGGTGVANTGLTLTLGGSISLPAAPGTTQCLHMTAAGTVTTTGTDCAAQITVGTTTIASGTTNQLLYDNGGVLGEVTKANSSLLVTNGTGVPSFSTSLPSGVTITAAALSGTFTGTPTFSGNLTFSGVPNFTNALSGTQTKCLGLSSGGALVAAGSACGTGGTITVNGGGNSTTGVSTVTFGNGFVASPNGSSVTSTVNTTLTDNTETTNYTVVAADMANAINLAGSTATLTLPAASSTVFAPGMSVAVVVTASGSWTVTNSTGLTYSGPTTLPPGTQGTFVANADAAHLDFFGTIGAAAVSHQFVNSVTAAGPQLSQPAITDISGLGTGVATALADNTNATGGFGTVGVSGTNVGLLNANKTDSGTNSFTGANTFAEVLGTENDQSGTTYTLQASDCGKTVAFSNSSAVTVTIAASIVPSAGTTCSIAIRQDGTGQVAVNGTAVSAATLVSAHSYTKTFGIHAVIGLELTTISATATAVLTGDGA